MAYDPSRREVEQLKKDLGHMPSLQDMLSVKGKVALVTGGTSGLGFDIAARFLEGGANVVIAGSSEYKAENALGVLGEIGYGPDRVRFCKTNIRDEEDVEKLVRFTDEAFGSLDILVTSAAVWSYAHIYDMPEEEFMKVEYLYHFAENTLEKFILIRPFAYYLFHGGVVSLSRALIYELCFRKMLEIQRLKMAFPFPGKSTSLAI